MLKQISRNTREIIFGIFPILIAITLSCRAMASTDDEEMEDFFAMSPAQLADLSVTIASGTSKRIDQAAGVASVITAEQIKAMGATQLHEVLETVPGLHVSLQAVTYDYIYTMRGIGNGTNSQILVLLNGTRYSLPFQGRSMTGLEMPVQDIQRIEVIRGPGSAMYGADAFAGVINIITKKANDIDGTVIGGRGGSWDTYSGWAQHGGKWAGWDVAASVQYQTTNGDPGRIIDSDAQTAIDAAFGTSASHAPGAMQTQDKNWNAHMNLQRKHWDFGFWAFNVNDAGLRAGVAAALDTKGRANGENYLADMRFSSEDWLQDWELQAHVSYLYTDFQAQFQIFPDNVRLPIGVNGSPDFIRPAGVVSFPQGVNEALGRKQRVPSVELNSIYRGLQDHVWRFAAGFRYEEIVTNDARNFGPGVINGSMPVVDGELTDVKALGLAYLPNMHRTIWSAMLQDEWQLAEHWHLTAGLRYDHYSDFGSTVNPRFALVWDVTPQFTSKLLYGKAFRAPTFAEQGNANNPVILGNPNLDPETINTVELAFDYRPWHNLRTAANVYYYSIEKLIQAVPDPGGNSTIAQNNGNQNGYGLELEWNWRITDAWNFRGNYAWQNARNEQINRRVAGVPKQQLYVAAEWQFIRQWYLQTQLNWVGQRISPPGDNRVLDNYETVDITLRSKRFLQHLDLAASVRNLFNAAAREPAVAQLPGNLPLPGRSFYLEASVHF